ncbi:MAG: four-helix bundle copper-binding protein [Gemmatimonadota bacterium]|nr:four-helix bundle copper-binding protein [Gemmatimonadota bacterium]
MPHQMKASPAMQSCIDVCNECHSVCIETVHHCLSLGGKHAEVGHITTLLDCADICRTSADFMLRGSERHPESCQACAAVCRACEESCRSMGDDEQMKKCADVCGRCAESCEKMASHRAMA